MHRRAIVVVVAAVGAAVVLSLGELQNHSAMSFRDQSDRPRFGLHTTKDNRAARSKSEFDVFTDI